MIAKTKEVLRKLEFGIIELLVGALMVIGLIGYFASVPADLDWIDHTVSFVLFSYLFYKLNITSILFGKTSRFANAIIVVSYFSLFFKDIISYTALDAFKFKIIKFVDYFYVFFLNNLSATNIFTFYIGVIGIVVISLYLTKKIEVLHPSLLYAVHQKRIKSSAVKFLSLFILLLGFYYFVYSIVLEWLEFTIDDPVIATGIIFFIYKIAKHREKFSKSDFVFKIGDFSTKLYRRFVSLFHYKKTLPLAISGLLILHALSDLGVFAYSLIFLRENFYLEFLKSEHTPFLKLFIEDAKRMPSFAAIPLFIGYALNALSLIVLLLIPIIVWLQMFSQKKLHFNRVFLFFVYSSVTAYILLPGYSITPITELSTREGISLGGVDILSASLLETKSILDRFFPNKTMVITAVSLISIIFGLAVYLLSSMPKAKRELYALSIIGGLIFYALYIFYFFSGLLDFYNGKLFEIVVPHFLIFMVLVFFLIMSILFYIGGYLMFVYEVVMEYHKRKWSEPIDEELVSAIRKIKKFEKRVMKPKKAQIIGEVLKYGLVGIFSIVILIGGYKLVNVVKERACNTEIAKFEIDLRNLDKSVRFGTRELRSYDAPCKADSIYFFDLNKTINPENFKNIPIIKDTLESKGNNNIFLVKEGEVKRSFYAGNLDMVYPYHICFTPKFDKISFFIEGAGNSAKVAGSCDQPECTFIPIDISEDEARKIIKEAIEFGCDNCPLDFYTEARQIAPTRQNIEMFRKFTFCDGITSVEIVIRPKKGAEVKEFRFYEFIPKSCIEDLNNYLAENVEGNVEIKGDPLIMWYFSDLGDEKKTSYKLSKEFSEECKQAIQGLGIAQFVEGEGPPIKGPNTAPTIGGLPDVVVSGTGLKRNVISNLWRYANDRETNPKNLFYTIIDQTNAGLVDCSITNEKHIDCNVKQNKEGTSIVTVQVDDFEFTDRATFIVEVSQFCKKHERKKCVGNFVYWFDSCNNQEVLEKACAFDEACKDGECEESCIPNVETKCMENEKIYWFDSCGKQGSLYYDCKDNFVRKNCRDAKCCIGNFFCQTPNPNCEDACPPGEKRCSGSGYQVCNDYNNDGCFEWGQATDCGSDSCDEFGSWTCKNSATRTRARTCYKKGCSDGSCYSNPLVDMQEEICILNQVCQNGVCVAQTCQDGTPKGQCSLTKPLYCNNALQLVNGCGTCGCPAGKMCQNDGSCANAVAQLSASYTITNTQQQGEYTYYYFTSTISETGGVVGVTINSRQKCYQSIGCDPVKTSIAEFYGTNHISPSGQISNPTNYFYSFYHPDKMTETFWGTDDNGNPITVSYEISVS